MAEIVLVTFNARWSHASLGLRCLMAALGPLRTRSGMVEFDLEIRPEEAVEAILALKPRIVGIGVYIWNTALATRTAGLLKQLAPEVVLILGGPEASFALRDPHPLFHLADYLVAGEGETLFPGLCRELLSGSHPPDKILIAPEAEADHLALPYDLYDDRDLAGRHLYVESSRGCPFRCAFCLSALDRSVRHFDRTLFLEAMQSLLDRGARRFKFVDRTFNLSDAHACAILDFFLAALRPGLFLHFEMIPDRLSEAIRMRLARFPPGALQLEIGIQSWQPATLAAIRRHQDNDRAEANLRWLLTATRAHLHTDLIVGLPGESPESFAAGFDRMVAIAPHEIQVGILKRLAGTPLAAADQANGMLFDPEPPYELLASAPFDFFTLRRFKRFARYWDLVGNSGRFPRTLAVVFAERSPFAAFMAFSDWLFAATRQTHQIALPRLGRLALEGFSTLAGMDQTALRRAVEADMLQASGEGAKGNKGNKEAGERSAPPPRQARHVNAS